MNRYQQAMIEYLIGGKFKAYGSTAHERSRPRREASTSLGQDDTAIWRNHIACNLLDRFESTSFLRGRVFLTLG